LDREPDNEAAESLLQQVSGQDLNAPLVTTLAQEREVNTFFRLNQASVIAHLRRAFPELPEDPDEETVFVKLRSLRNSW
jgi:hydroxyacylglutathione hydrolase